MTHPSEVNEILEFDHVVRVDADGEMQDTLLTTTPIYAPEVYIDGDITPVVESQQDWALVRGKSNQQGYSGPIMHPSEFISDTWGKEILSEPGYYCVTEVRDLSSNGEEPVGWVLAFLPLEEA